MDFLADGLEVALLGEARQQSLHAAVELLLVLELVRRRRSRQETEGDNRPAAPPRRLRVCRFLIFLKLE